MNKKFINLYANFLKRFIKVKRPIKVVFDCSNGTTGIILRKLLRTFKLLNFKLINWRPNGRFPAHGPNPMAEGAMDQLRQEVMKLRRWDGAPTAKRVGADLGVIFDGDGDRVFFIDNLGRLIDANEIGYILMQMFKPPFVVGEVSSWRLKKYKTRFCDDFNIADNFGSSQDRKLNKIFISRVGHYFFKKLMREKKANLGTEHSGHYYFRNFFYCDAGIFAAIQLMNFVSELISGHPISKNCRNVRTSDVQKLKIDLAGWLDKLPKYYRSGEINFKVSDKEKVLNKIEKYYKKQAIKISKLDGLTMKFCGGSPSEASAKDWWFNLRPSNTENLLRLNMEAKQKSVLDKKLAEIKKILK